MNARGTRCVSKYSLYCPVPVGVPQPVLARGGGYPILAWPGYLPSGPGHSKDMGPMEVLWDGDIMG